MEADARDLPRFVVQALVSAFFLAFGAWVILGDFGTDIQKAAFGWMGIVLGYWLS